jgi:S1-C subfamily serine protease
MSPSFVSFSDQLAQTVEQASQSIVAVHGRHRFNSSGVRWLQDLIVTADHALRRDDDIRVTIADGSTVPATLAGRDPGTDLAVLRVPGLRIPLATRSSQPLLPGSAILAVGRSKDGPTAAFGVIGSLAGPAQSSRGGKLDQVIRVNVDLHPVGAGGAIVDASGAVIGIATPVLSRFSVFAVPASTVDRVAIALAAHGRIVSGYLGVGLQPIALPEHLMKKLGGEARPALVAVSVDEDGPAARAGMAIGDILIELAGRPTRSPRDVQELLTDAAGKQLPAKILRGGAPIELQITPTERPRKRD